MSQFLIDISNALRELGHTEFSFLPTYDSGVWAAFQVGDDTRTFHICDGYTFGGCAQDAPGRYLGDIDLDPDHEGDSDAEGLDLKAVITELMTSTKGL